MSSAPPLAHQVILRHRPRASAAPRGINSERLPDPSAQLAAQRLRSPRLRGRWPQLEQSNLAPRIRPPEQDPEMNQGRAGNPEVMYQVGGRIVPHDIVHGGGRRSTAVGLVRRDGEAAEDLVARDDDDVLARLHQ